jgi:hypothetical protein
MDQLACIPLNKIDLHPAFQVRQRWDPQDDPALAGLATSLEGPEGLIHPIVVVQLARPTAFGRTYALIAGQRRLEAARRLGWTTIQARVLPPCDLTMPVHKLRLLAIAVRENTEREPLHPEDRREALRRLKDLYDAVYPHAYGQREPDETTPPRSAPFTRWAAQTTGISTRTIERDLRRVLMAIPSLPTGVPVAAPPTEAPVTDRLQYAATAGQALTTALEELAVALTPEICAALPTAQRTAVQQALQALQEALATLYERLTNGQSP